MAIDTKLDAKARSKILEGHERGLSNEDLAGIVRHGSTADDIQEVIDHGISYDDLTDEEKLGIKHGKEIGLPRGDIARIAGVPVALIDEALASGVRPKTGKRDKSGGVKHSLSWQGEERDV